MICSSCFLEMVSLSGTQMLTSVGKKFAYATVCLSVLECDAGCLHCASVVMTHSSLFYFFFPHQPFLGSGQASNRIHGKITMGSDVLAIIDGHWDQEIYIKDRALDKVCVGT